MATYNNIEPLSMDNIYQGRAVAVLVTNAGTPEEREDDLGLVTVAEVEPESESTDIASSNLPVRAVIGKLQNETSLKLNLTTQSITREVRALATFGLEEVYAMPADPDFEKVVGAIATGQRIPLGRRVNDIELGDLVEGQHFRTANNGRAVIILDKPVGTPASVTITGSAPAVTGAVKVKMGPNANREVHIRIYGVERGKEDHVMDIPRGIIAPTGPLGMIGENDPIEAEFEISAIPDAEGVFGTSIIG